MPKMDLLIKKVYSNIFNTNRELILDIFELKGLFIAKKLDYAISVSIKDNKIYMFHLYIKMFQTFPNTFDALFDNNKILLNSDVYYIIKSWICGRNFDKCEKNNVIYDKYNRRSTLGKFGHLYNKDEFY